MGIEAEPPDVRTITAGISCFDCIDPDIERQQKNYNKIVTKAKDLVAVGMRLRRTGGIV